MKAIKLLLYTLAGLIASTTLSRVALEVEAILWIVGGGMVMWMWSLTYYGHEFFKKILHLDDAEIGTLRAALLVLFIAGILINHSFGDYSNG